MTEAQTALARRAVACKGFRWVPGMLRLRATPTWSRDHLRMEGRAPDGGDTWDYAAWPVIPDVTDAATVGCLLALVREAWGDRIVAKFGNGWWELETDGARWDDGNTQSFVEALVAALESAP